MAEIDRGAPGAHPHLGGLPNVALIRVKSLNSQGEMWGSMMMVMEFYGEVDQINRFLHLIECTQMIF